MAESPKGFLGRWARRKTDASQGKPLEEPVAVAQPGAAGAPLVNSPSLASAVATPALVPSSASGQPPQPEKMLSLDDVKLLTQDSDFKPFMAGNVGAEVRNAAMKKLFADPHFNVMDGLDTYIGDYSQPDPIPASMMRQMVGAKFLKLFDSEEKDDAKGEADAGSKNHPDSALPENPDDSNTEIVAQSFENLATIPPGRFVAKNPDQTAPSPDVAVSQVDRPAKSGDCQITKQ